MNLLRRIYNKMRVKKTWLTGKNSEILFWENVISGKDDRYAANFRGRIAPDRQFNQRLVPLIITSPIENAQILDIAAGPVTQLGWLHNGRKLSIRAVDALADEYEKLLAKYGLTAPVVTEKCEAELVDNLFQAGTFDLIYIRNGLDHCYDPLKVLKAAIRLLKPGAILIIESHIDEGKSAGYSGLHQWNISVENGKMVIWRPDNKYIINDVFHSEAQIEYENQENLNQISFKITKKAIHPNNS